MWSDWLVFCDCGFQSVCPLMEKDKRLTKDSWWERLTGMGGRWWWKLGLVLVGGATLSKSLIQFSVQGWSCVPSLLFTWGQTMVEVMKIKVTSFKWSHTCTATLIAPNPATGHHQPTPLLLDTPGQIWVSLLKVGKTNRPFRYDLNQITYYFIVEVRNRFKGLDLIECLKNWVHRFMT